VSVNQASYRIATMCRVLGVSPSGFYVWQKRPPSARSHADAELSLRVSKIHQRSDATYGAPRVHAELQAEGIKVERKRVARLLKKAGLVGVSRRKWIHTPRSTISRRSATKGRITHNH
jgi:putative transposase